MATEQPGTEGIDLDLIRLEQIARRRRQVVVRAAQSRARVAQLAALAVPPPRRPV